MQKTMNKRFILSFLWMSLCMIWLTACQETVPHTPSAEKDNLVTQEATLLGQGQTYFYFTVVDQDQNETYFEIHTDKTTVGEALKELNLISGEEGPYGLNVKTVNQITVDYDKDKLYWAFYIDGNYAPTGVDDTDIMAGSQYTLKVQKA